MDDARLAKGLNVVMTWQRIVSKTVRVWTTADVFQLRR